MVDRFHEECGIVGVYGHPEAANFVYLGLYALQHRGQEGAGIVVSDGSLLLSHRGLGLVADVFNQPIIQRLEGESAIGHNRYSTTGQTLLKSVLAQTFATRRLRVRGWYSANILGNHDGLMLSDPRYCDVIRARYERFAGG